VEEPAGRRSNQCTPERTGYGNIRDVIEDDENVTKQLTIYLQKVPQSARYFKVNIHPDGNPNPEDVAQAAKERIIVLLREFFDEKIKYTGNPGKKYEHP